MIIRRRIIEAPFKEEKVGPLQKSGWVRRVQRQGSRRIPKGRRKIPKEFVDGRAVRKESGEPTRARVPRDGREGLGAAAEGMD
jgi:hypothetical protein